MITQEKRESMKKKIISMILASVMVFTTLCGCGSGQGQNTESGETTEVASEAASGQASSDEQIVLSVSVMANEEEKKILKPTKPPLELAEIRKSFVNKYSFVQIENNFYSVPEYLVGLTVTSKIYYNKILIYSNNEFVCEHKKIDGNKKISANIRHYLKTLTFKPGALRNSYVLKSNPKLKSIFDKYYTNNPKKFIDIISKNKEVSDEELEEILITNSGNLVENTRYNNNINNLTRIQTSMYNQIMIGVVKKNEYKRK